MNPRAVVAVILAITVMLFMLSNTGLGYLIGLEPPAAEKQPIVEAWLNLTNVLIGGLIGYIAGRNNDE